jgi:hypothetical protein
VRRSDAGPTEYPLAVQKKHFHHNRANAMVEMFGVWDLSALQHKIEAGVLGLLLELEKTW